MWRSIVVVHIAAWCVTLTSGLSVSLRRGDLIGGQSQFGFSGPSDASIQCAEKLQTFHSSCASLRRNPTGRLTDDLSKTAERIPNVKNLHRSDRQTENSILSRYIQEVTQPPGLFETSKQSADALRVGGVLEVDAELFGTSKQAAADAQLRNRLRDRSVSPRDNLFGNLSPKTNEWKTISGLEQIFGPPGQISSVSPPERSQRVVGHKY